MIGHLRGDLPADPGAGGDVSAGGADVGTFGAGTSGGSRGTLSPLPGATGGVRQAPGGGGPIGGTLGLTFNTASDYPIPPGGCIILRVPMSAAEAQAFVGNTADDSGEIMAALAPIKRQRIQQAIAGWSANFPGAPPALLRVGGNTSTSLSVYVVRPATQYDPLLDRYPVYPPGSPQSDAFNAGLRLFFPDFALDPLTGAQLTGGRTGSMTIYGPFPVTEKFVTPQMVALAVHVAQMPGAFQIGSVGGSSGPDFLGALGTGAQATVASHGNIYVGAAAAATKFIISAFDWLFSGPPQPPAWLTALEQEKMLREGNGPPSFNGTISGAGTFYRGIQCPRVTINPRGTMTLEQGYQAFISELTGGRGKIPWLLLGGAAAAVYALTR